MAGINRRKRRPGIDTGIKEGDDDKRRKEQEEKGG